MTSNTDFMASLMKIPYFAQLAQDHGEQWLADKMATLETSSFDFGKYAYFDDSYDSASSDQGGSVAAEVGAGAAHVDHTAMVDLSDPTSANSTDSEAKTASSVQETIDQQAAMATSQTTTTEAAQDTSSSSGSDSSSSSGDGKSHDHVPDHFANDWDNYPPLQYFDESNRQYVAMMIYFRERSEGGDFGSGDQAVQLNGFFQSLKLGAGDDQIYLGGQHHDSYGFDHYYLDGGDGTDTLHLNHGSGFTLTLGGENNLGHQGGLVTISDVENIVGSVGNDTLTGDGGDNSLSGGAGNDTLAGGDGNDILYGDAGDDNLSGGAGNDTINGGDGNDTIDGGDGNNVLDGGDGNNTITGGAGNDAITGGSGSDVITAGDGSNDVDGGAGDDKLTAGSGNDTITGGGGNDTITAGDGNDLIDTGSGTNTVAGGAGDDTISGGNDSDTIDGGAGSDIIAGGAGSDTITGGAGDDTITGGTGADTLTGGTGDDVFAYTAKKDSPTDSFDFITDFAVAHDKFDLSALGDTFIFKGTDDFAGGGDASVRYVKEASDTLVQIDTNGDGTADMQIKLDEAVDLTASNFIL